MKIFQKFFKDNQKLNAKEVAVELSNGKYKILDSKLKEIDRPLKKLWENSNTSNIFNPQAITLSSDDYDYLLWFFIDVTGTASNRYMMSVCSLKGWNVNFLYPFDGQVSGTNNYYNTNWKRSAEYVSDTSFNIGACIGKRGAENGSVTNNIYCIPAIVYGGKF